MTTIDYIFPKLWTRKDMVREMAKKFRFRGPLERQHCKRAEKPFQSQRQHLYHIYLSLWR